jgi:hypothetical protein
LAQEWGDIHDFLLRLIEREDTAGRDRAIFAGVEDE